MADDDGKVADAAFCCPCPACLLSTVPSFEAVVSPLDDISGKVLCLLVPPESAIKSNVLQVAHYIYIVVKPYLFDMLLLGPDRPCHFLTIKKGVCQCAACAACLVI